MFLKSKLLEENYNNDIANFNEEWNTKLNDFNSNSKKVEEILSERHRKEMGDLVKLIEDKYNEYPPKFSSTYLKYKDSEKRLVKMEE
jgi:hypothetical protein